MMQSAQTLQRTTRRNTHRCRDSLDRQRVRAGFNGEAEPANDRRRRRTENLGPHDGHVVTEQRPTVARTKRDDHELENLGHVAKAWRCVHTSVKGIRSTSMATERTLAKSWIDPIRSTTWCRSGPRERGD